MNVYWALMAVINFVRTQQEATPVCVTLDTELMWTSEHVTVRNTYTTGMQKQQNYESD